MQGMTENNGVLVLAATNLPWMIDSAMRRRLEKRIYISLPDENERYELLKKMMQNETNHSLSDQDFIEIASSTPLYSGSDMASLINNACMEPIRKFQNAKYFRSVQNSQNKTLYTPCGPSEPGAFSAEYSRFPDEQVCLNPVNKWDFIKALTETKATVNPSLLHEYEEWTANFGIDG